jgi:hypothetical protein
MEKVFHKEPLGFDWRAAVEDILMNDAADAARALLTEADERVQRITVRVPVALYVEFSRVALESEGAVFAGDAGVSCVCTQTQPGVCVCKGACPDSCECAGSGPIVALAPINEFI